MVCDDAIWWIAICIGIHLKQLKCILWKTIFSVWCFTCCCTFPHVTQSFSSAWWCMFSLKVDDTKDLEECCFLHSGCKNLSLMELLRTLTVSFRGWEVLSTMDDSLALFLFSLWAHQWSFPSLILCFCCLFISSLTASSRLLHFFEQLKRPQRVFLDNPSGPWLNFIAMEPGNT